MLKLDELRPMLLDERPLDLEAPGWICEIKFDGYRLLAELDDGVRLITRNGADATKWFPEVAASLAKVQDGPYVIDGEVCVLDDRGRSDFNLLHERARRRRRYAGGPDVVYCVFDLLMNRGVDVTQQPLVKRKAALAKLFKRPLPSIMYVGHFEGKDAARIFEDAVVPMKLEGLVAKRAASFYQPGVRSSDWVKVKRKGAVPAERFKR
ncbi:MULTISPECIES: ATP-dependent DNA ligase [Variovorax]|uniref:ATP-dependent DNA ligase n=1 Tax=Variovorax TaxID=34072 RepID=UPI00285975DB|nr:RNA ligase family protein [Variovorax sp. 3319]MDR6886172.1 bifunctional non-homologous end joining protein LigD [Variovorax sp. 3319]